MVGAVGLVMVRCDGVCKTVRRVCAILNSCPVGHYLFRRPALPFRFGRLSGPLAGGKILRWLGMNLALGVVAGGVAGVSSSIGVPSL